MSYVLLLVLCPSRGIGEGRHPSSAATNCLLPCFGSLILLIRPPNTYTTSERAVTNNCLRDTDVHLIAKLKCKNKKCKVHKLLLSGHVIYPLCINRTLLHKLLHLCTFKYEKSLTQMIVFKQYQNQISVLGAITNPRSIIHLQTA